MKIKRFDPAKKKTDQNIFYVQSHGLNAGRPLKMPIPNSWEIESENTQAFEICFVVFNSKILQPYLRGSVIPFIALHEYKKIIYPFLKIPIDEDCNKKLETLRSIDRALAEMESRNRLYRQLKNVLAYELIKKLNAQY
jgi:hypothetical protein